MDDPEVTAETLAGYADDIVLDRKSTLTHVSGEYKDARQPDFDEALEEVNVEDAVEKAFPEERLRFGDIHLPKDVPERLRYLIAKNFAKAAAKQLALSGPHEVKGWMRGIVYSIATEKLTQRLLTK